jgi:hypothetical protein
MPDFYITQFVDMDGFETRPCPAAPVIARPFGLHHRTPQQETWLKNNDASEGSSNPKY